MPDTLAEYRRNLQTQNLQQQVRDNNEAARNFRKIQQDLSRFPASAQKGPAFESLVNRLGQQRTPAQIAQQNLQANAQLSALGAGNIADDFSIDPNRRFAPAFRVNQTWQPFPQTSPVQDARDPAPQVWSAFGDQGWFAGGQYFANSHDFLDNVPSAPPQGIVPPQGQQAQPSLITRWPGAWLPVPPEQQVQQAAPTAQPWTVEGAQATTQQTELQPTPTGWVQISDNQIAQFQGTDDANRERITSAYSNLSNMLNENNAQYTSLMNLVDRDEKGRLLNDQQYYTSTYGPNGEMERLNNEFYTWLQNFMAKQWAERTALAQALWTRPWSTTSQVNAQIAQQEAQQLWEILKVKQQQLSDLDRVRRTFVDLEQRFRQEYSGITDKNIVNTFKEIKGQRDQIATAYTEAIRQYDQQLQALNRAASWGTTQATPSTTWWQLTSEQIAQLTPL